MVPGGRPLISVGYEYKMRKVLSFIIIVNLGSTNSGLADLSNYPDQYYNITILPVGLPLVMYKLFV